MNRVILIGRLAADPEIRTTQSGTNVATYRLAVNRRRKPDGTQEADFITCVAWDKGANFARDYLRKGAKIAVEGRLQTRSYDAQDGSKRHVCEVVVDSHEFCESKASGGQYGAQSYEQPQSAPDAGRQMGMHEGFQEVDTDELPF